MARLRVRRTPGLRWGGNLSPWKPTWTARHPYATRTCAGAPATPCLRTRRGCPIDLDLCARRITSLTQRERLRHKHRAPAFFEYRPAPLRITQDVHDLVVGPYQTADSVDLVLYDFGAISVADGTPFAGTVAKILRSERDALPADEIRDATTHHISYGANDVTIIDWDATLLFEREAEDVRAVLEFANVELLEMRYLDQQLDDALDQAYQALFRYTWRRMRLPGARRGDLRRIARLQVDNAILFEGVNNALKLLGDQYLARVYRLASVRFHLAEWDASILRKLETLDSISAKMSDAAANWRMEVLEWIIIILSALSIVVYFVPGITGP